MSQWTERLVPAPTGETVGFYGIPGVTRQSYCTPYQLAQALNRTGIVEGCDILPDVWLYHDTKETQGAGWELVNWSNGGSYHDPQGYWDGGTGIDLPAGDWFLTFGGHVSSFGADALAVFAIGPESATGAPFYRRGYFRASPGGNCSGHVQTLVRLDSDTSVGAFTWRGTATHDISNPAIDADPAEFTATRLR